MRTAVQLTILGAFIFVIIVGLYSELTEQPPPPTKWIENPEMKRPTPLKSANEESNYNFSSTRTNQSSYGYEIDNEDTWDDFLEDIEMRGLEYTDPDAVEIWELEYK